MEKDINHSGAPYAFVKEAARTIPDFPVKGVQFRDLTTVLKNPKLFRTMVEAIAAEYKGRGITKVAGIESRGFILGAALALELGAGFVPIRKPGKLPADVVRATYEKEYGTDTIEMHRDAIGPDDVVLIHDDILATGGTMVAACQLVRSLSPAQVFINFIATIPSLNGLAALPQDIEETHLIEF